MHQASLHGGSLPRFLPGHIWGISVWKLWNIRASKELKEQIEKIKIEKKKANS
jgi:hypothetical protein